MDASVRVFFSPDMGCYYRLLSSQMMIPLILMSSILGLAVVGSYVVVLGNVNDAFPLPHPPPASSSYFDSPYWLGIPHTTAAGLTVLQLCAAVGYVVWFVWLVSTPPPLHGLLSTAAAQAGLLGGFLVASVAWPYAAYALLHRPHSLGRALLSCLPLWAAAVCVILLIGGTFEARAPVLPTVGILLLGQVVVLADGVGWSALAVYHSVVHS